jgi:hypothetical protein
MDSPVGSVDSQAVEASLTGDSTEPQPAPERRPTPVSSQPRRSAERSRRSTLVSPIPALMAASMRDTVGTGTMFDASREAIPVAAQTQNTARLEEQAQAALRFDGEPDYVVEIDASKKHG